MTATDPGPAAGADFSTRALYALPPGCTLDAVTSDGHGLAFVTVPEEGVQLLWDGDPGQPFEGLGEMRDKTAAVFCSEDGAHVAYVGKRGERMFVGRDAGEDPSVESFSRSVPPVFSREGRHLAYGAEVAGAFRLIVDGQAIGELPIAPIEAVWSPDGERLAYVELREAAKNVYECRIVIDGVAGPWFDGLRNAGGAMQFSPDSRRFAYYRVDGEGHCQWVVDGVAQRLANEVPTVSIARMRRVGVVEPPLAACFSPDSRRFAYFADVVEKGVAILEDDVPGPLFKGVGVPVFSPDSRRLAYLAQTYEKQLTLVVDGVPGPERPGDWGGTPVFSGDSRHVAVAMLREEGGILRKRHFVSLSVDGRTIAEVEGDSCIQEAAFSPDGERVAWWAGHGEIRHVMVNEARHTHDAVALSNPVFTSAGRLVYAALVRSGQTTILVDGRPGPLADVLAAPQSSFAVFENPRTGRPTHPFAVSPDGEHVVWAGVFGDEWRPVIDDRLGPSFEQVFVSAFEADGTAVWWAQRGEVVYRVTAPTVPPAGGTGALAAVGAGAAGS